jgi:hypothetical protein
LTLWIIKGIHWELEDSLQPIRDEFIKWCPSWDSASPPLLLTGGLYSTIAPSSKELDNCGDLPPKLDVLARLSSHYLLLNVLRYSGSVTAIAVATTDLIMAMIINLQN